MSYNGWLSIMYRRLSLVSYKLYIIVPQWQVIQCADNVTMFDVMD